jgi:hypothetical protein
MKTIKNILLYIWQLPQNIIGGIILLYCKLFYGINECIYYDWTLGTETKYKYYVCKKFSGGISLGNHIIVSSDYWLTVKHEIGHQKQSMYLGPLYLFVIGIPSIIWAGLYGDIIKYTKNGYYKFYTEKWADKLSNITRN